MITSKIVPESSRLRTLPRMFPSVYPLVENAVYYYARHLCSDYEGGCWDFYKLSNGGFFMALGEPMHLSNPMNYSDETISGEAAGLVICIYAYSLVGEHVLEKLPNIADTLFQQIDLLKYYADKHPEGQKIFRLID